MPSQLSNLTRICPVASIKDTYDNSIHLFYEKIIERYCKLTLILRAVTQPENGRRPIEKFQENGCSITGRDTNCSFPIFNRQDGSAAIINPRAIEPMFRSKYIRYLPTDETGNLPRLSLFVQGILQ
jgi:hypothetical protein